MSENDKELIRNTRARAITELRTRLRWNQDRLADELQRHAEGEERLPRPRQQIISRWENGEFAPPQHYRNALAKIARGHKQLDLAVIFEAAPVAWDLVVAVVGSGLANTQ